MSPLTATEIISTRAEFHGICGFTSDQVKLLVRTYFSSSNRSDKDFDYIYRVMNKYYGGYRFAEPSKEQLDTLSNPQIIYYFMSELKSHGRVARPGESPAVHLTKILRSIADTGDFSVQDIIQLMTAGFLASAIVDEFGYADLMAELGVTELPPSRCWYIWGY